MKKGNIHSVGFISLGCPKALVDTEQIVNLLVSEDIRIVPSFQEADLVVVNTCGFIDAAVKESLDSIKEAKKKWKSYRHRLFRCKKKFGWNTTTYLRGAWCFGGYGAE